MEHLFHIPVLGIGYSVDSPVKVAHYGISSVMPIGDHQLLEQLRKFYAGKYNFEYEEIKPTDEDGRARMITAYLNMVADIIDLHVADLKASSFSDPKSEITKYFEMLPLNTANRIKYDEMMGAGNPEDSETAKELREAIVVGSADVNIMTKLDKVNYGKKGVVLPVQFNDAHAAIRGFAMSRLSSSVVLSAGMNPYLFSYMGELEDFFPDEKAQFNKKIVLKVSDFRSALVQGKMLAKKGLWVSEYRIESGLNCGGHAFATEGKLLGPILNEFKERKEELIENLFPIYSEALKTADKKGAEVIPRIGVSVQGGLGTAEEQQFLLDHYGVDSVGWGTAFMLVPEAVNVDPQTLELLVKAKEEDVYLSPLSPLGVPFNSLRDNTEARERQGRLDAGKPGSPCIKKYLVLNTEFTDQPICTASSEYQKKKVKELQASGLSEPELKDAYDRIHDKACLCVGLTNPALIVNEIETFKKRDGVAVCPGPNIAYFDKVATLKQMVDHIYGKINLISRTDRPQMFIKELSLYIDNLKEQINDKLIDVTPRKIKSWNNFVTNLNEGIEYYRELFGDMKIPTKDEIMDQLKSYEAQLKGIQIPTVAV